MVACGENFVLLGQHGEAAGKLMLMIPEWWDLVELVCSALEFCALQEPCGSRSLLSEQLHGPVVTLLANCCLSDKGAHVATTKHRVSRISS